MAITGVASPLMATPESRAGALFLLISPSVRVNGLGQAGVALVDEPGAYYNPGSVPLSSPTHTFQSRFYTSGMEWLPNLVDGSYNYVTAQLASERELNDQFLGQGMSVRVAVHASRTKLDLGPVTRTSERGASLGTFQSKDTANQVGVGLALRSIFDVGVGVTAKSVSSHVSPEEGEGNTFDYGVLVRVPLATIFETAISRSLVYKNHLRPELDVSYGRAWRNRGGDIDYGDFTDPFPANRNTGWAAAVGLAWRSESLELAIGRVLMTEETYRPEVDGISGPDEAEDEKNGVELELLETLAFRSGESSDYDGDVLLSTSGLSLRSDGIFKLLAARLENRNSVQDHKTLIYLLRHLSVSWSKFEYEGRGGGNPLQNLSHTFVGLSF